MALQHSVWRRMLTLLLACVSFSSVAAVTAPADDPFYTPPAGFESTAPGTVLRSRTVVSGIVFGLLPNPVQTFQLLYRTQSLNGTAIAGTTTVFKPFLARNDRFISYHTAYDSSATTCQPSYNYQYGAPPTNAITAAEQFLIEAYVTSGYIVSSPDYEGPEAAWTAGRLSGTGVLDSMRAVTNFRQSLGINTDKPKIVGQGYSGGAIATGWAASLQPKYAPELQIQGWAQGGTPANLTGTATFIDGTLFSGFLPAAIAGLLKPSAYAAQLAPLLQRIITPEGQAAIDYGATHCGVDAVTKYPFQTIASEKYQTEGARLYYDPTLAPVLADNVMGVKADETPTVPVFLYHATEDEIIPYPNVTTLYNSWCKNGASVDFVTYANGGHGTTLFVAFPEIYKWTMSAFAGSVTKGACKQSTTLDDDLNPLALGVSLEPILVNLLNALAKFGPKDANVKKDPSILAQPI